MKKLIFIICLAMFMVTGCTSGNDNKPAGNNSQNESQMQSWTDNDNGRQNRNRSIYGKKSHCMIAILICRELLMKHYQKL